MKRSTLYTNEKDNDDYITMWLEIDIFTFFNVPLLQLIRYDAI